MMKKIISAAFILILPIAGFCAEVTCDFGLEDYVLLKTTSTKLTYIPAVPYDSANAILNIGRVNLNLNIRKLDADADYPAGTYYITVSDRDAVYNSLLAARDVPLIGHSVGAVGPDKERFMLMWTCDSK